VTFNEDQQLSICSECRILIRKAYNFKLQCQKAMNFFSLNLQPPPVISNMFAVMEDHATQTAPIPVFQQHDYLAREHQDDENYEEEEHYEVDQSYDCKIKSIEEEEGIFIDANDSPMIEQSIEVKTEDADGVVEYENAEFIVSDLENDNEFEEVDEQHQQLLQQSVNQSSMDIEVDGNEDIVCDVNPFTAGEEVDSSGGELKAKLHTCEKCDRSFSRATHLKRHMLTHEEVKPIQCTICTQRFSRADHLSLHMNSKHSDSTKKYQCNHCDTRFARLDLLTKHVKTKHDGNTKKEVCSLCQKTFSSKKYLRIHITKCHSGEQNKSIVCKFCSEEFQEKTEHQEHMRKMHPDSEAKPYLCSECGLRFVRNDYLVIHMRRHLGKFPCHL